MSAATYTPQAGTIAAQDHHHLVAAHITKMRTGSVGSGADEPLHTVTSGGVQARPGTGNAMGLVASTLVKLRGTSNSAASNEPLATVSAGGWHHAEVRALLLAYYGTDQDAQLTNPLPTATTRDRFAVVTVAGQDYSPLELLRAPHRRLRPGHRAPVGGRGRHLQPPDPLVHGRREAAADPTSAAIVSAACAPTRATRRRPSRRSWPSSSSCATTATTSADATPKSPGSRTSSARPRHPPNARWGKSERNANASPRA
jgi:hypothetical protein